MTRVTRLSRRSVVPAVAPGLAVVPVFAEDQLRGSPSPEPPKIDVTAFVDVYYGYNFNKVDPCCVRRTAQHVLPEHGRGQLHEGDPETG
jgi:hypothetical protein